ncbi:MAG: flagellar hook-associated protein FlgK [Lentisphaerae bacterium RIFOXYB12_FULL_65_16]|nr:MAG: flagellar hook-associated protein FlgK [Lentisphaerae bacterium RIFOXYA12_64_32]OGV92061.1 MAG: flagellar hook-associated protein FlgK [Lentisphaerae bacterium RIFOXYB12_FULL_65_16]
MAGLQVAMLTGKNALLVRQREMNVVGNNIANAGRAGYHRQTAVLLANPSVEDSSGQYGTGARVAQVMRDFDGALETNLRHAITEDGYRQVAAEQLQTAEGVLAPNGTSALSESVSRFALALQQVAAEPENSALRENLLQAGDAVAEQFNLTREGLTRLQTNILDSSGRGVLADNVEQINDVSQQISDLNRQISQLENRLFNPQQANDLRDRRDELVSQLARLADIEATENSNGTLTISIDGTALVDGLTDPERLALGTDGSGLPILIWQATSAPVVQAEEGETQSLVDAYAYLEALVGDLDNFADTWSNSLNTAHAAGFDTSGNAGGDLFSVDAGTHRMAFQLTRTADFAAASAAGAAGDGGNARNLWQTMMAPSPALDDQPLADYAEHLTDTVAAQTASARGSADAAKAAVSMFRDAVTSKSGVNTDEEMLAMLEIQRAYQATAKFAATANDMIGTVINMV